MTKHPTDILIVVAGVIGCTLLVLSTFTGVPATAGIAFTGLASAGLLLSPRVRNADDT